MGSLGTNGEEMGHGKWPQAEPTPLLQKPSENEGEKSEGEKSRKVLRHAPY